MYNVLDVTTHPCPKTSTAVQLNCPWISYGMGELLHPTENHMKQLLILISDIPEDMALIMCLGADLPCVRWDLKVYQNGAKRYTFILRLGPDGN